MLATLYYAKAAYGRSSEQGRTVITDLVEVTLRKWAAEDQRDIFLQATVLVDGEMALASRRCISPHLPEIELQTTAAIEFKELLISHPSMYR